MSARGGAGRWLKWAGSAAAVVALAFVVVTLQRNLAALPPVVLSGRLVVAAVLGVAANVVVVGLSAAVWRELLRGAGVEMPWVRSFAICGTAQIGKYLPGNVFHLVGRAALAAKEGVALPVAAASLTVETLAILGTGGLLAAPLLVERWDSFQKLIGVSAAWLWLGLGAVSLAVVALAWIFVRKRLQETLVAARGMLQPRALVAVVLLDATTFVILGASLYFIAAAAWPAGSGLSLSSCIFAFTLAWVLGFVTPGAPGGVGVREAVFLIVIGGAVGAGTGAALGIVSRLQSIVGDVVTFGLARVIERRRLARLAREPTRACAPR